MKVFLDDLRIPPAGWILVKTAREAIELLKTGKVGTGPERRIPTPTYIIAESIMGTGR